MTRARVLSSLIALMGVPSMAQAPQAPLFAFTSPDSAATWQAVNDGVMGGVSDGRFRITERQTLEFYGTLSLENNGGFASVRSRPRTLGLQTGDTLVARVRGDGREYQLNLYTAERMRAFSYRAPMKTRAGEWIEVAISLDRFEATSFGRVLRGAGPVDPRSVTSIGFLLAEKTPGPFELEVAWVNVLRGQQPRPGDGTQQASDDTQSSHPECSHVVGRVGVHEVVPIEGDRLEINARKIHPANAPW